MRHTLLTAFIIFFSVSSFANFPSPELAAITSGDGKLVAVGYVDHSTVADDWSPLIIVSTDGARSWQKAQLPKHTKAFLRGIAFGKERFVAVGWNKGNTTLVSEDGIKWKHVRIPEALNAFDAVTFFNDRFFAVDRASYLWTSENGVNWIKSNPLNIGDNPSFSTNQDSLILAGDGNAIHLLRANAGWKSVILPNSSGPHGFDFSSLAWNGEEFAGILSYDCCFGENPKAREVYSIQFSPNSLGTIKIIKLQQPELFAASKIELFQNAWIAVSSQGAFRSHDMKSWKNTLLPRTTTRQYKDVTISSGSIFVLANDTIYSSADGDKWSLKWSFAR